MHNAKRLYILVRADLPLGLQVAQACHAAREWTLAHPQVDVGDNLVVLHVPNQDALLELTNAAPEHLLFREPDLQNEATALALPGEARRRLSSLPLVKFPSVKASAICHTSPLQMQ
jgi:hypothetical protein